MNRVVRSFLVSMSAVAVVVGGLGAASLTARADTEVVATGGHVTSGPLPGDGVPQLPKPGDAAPAITSDPTLPTSGGTTAPGGEIPDPGAPGGLNPADPGNPDPGAGNPTTAPTSDPGQPANPGGGTGDIISQIVAMIMQLVKMFTGGGGA